MRLTPDISALLPDDATIGARRAALVDNLNSQPPRRRSKRTRKFAVAFASLFLVSGGAIAAGFFSGDDVAVEAGVGCYDRASLDANVTAIDATADPVKACAALWRRGVVSAHPLAIAPSLVACTAPGQPVRVFPGSTASVCHALDLMPLPGDYPTAALASQRASTALEHLQSMPSTASECPSPEGFAERARARLSDEFPRIDVVVDGSARCAGGYSVVGARIAVLTVSEETAHSNYVAAQIESALRPVFADPSQGCRAPAPVAEAVRRALAEARLRTQVEVSGDGACVAHGLAISGGQDLVTVPTEDREPR